MYKLYNNINLISFNFFTSTFCSLICSLVFIAFISKGLFYVEEQQESSMSAYFSEGLPVQKSFLYNVKLGTVPKLVSSRSNF